jgi:hypothetical protein
VQSAQVFLTKPYPSSAISCCPKVACQTADKTLAAIVDLDKLLITLIAALHRHGLSIAGKASASAAATHVEADCRDAA